MYKVVFYRIGGNVSVREFISLSEAVKFANTLPINSVLEIKKYDNKTNNI